MRHRVFFSISIKYTHTHTYKEHIVMPQHMFAELAGSAGRALLNTIDFFRDEPLIKWVLGLGDRDLTTLRDLIKNMRGLRASLKKNEEDAVTNFDGRAMGEPRLDPSGLGELLRVLRKKRISTGFLGP